MLKLLAFLAAVAMTLAAASAAADGVPPGMLVYPLDPKRDLTSTRPGWEKPFTTPINCGEKNEPVINAPLPVTPFTEAEVIALAKKAGRYIPPPVNKSGPGLVQTKEKGAVSPAVYATQLNHIENFVAQYGYSLRSPTIGTVARLRPRSDGKGNFNCTPMHVPSLKPVPPDWHIQEQWRRETLWRSNPAIRRWMSGRAFEPGPAATLRARPSDALDRWWDSAGTGWFGIEWRNAQRAQPRTTHRAPVIASVDMKPMLKPIVAIPRGADRVELTALGNVGVTMPMGNGCGPGGGLNPVCSPEDADHPACKPSSGGASETITGGQVTKSTCGTKSDCLRKGSFLLTLPPWQACVGQNGGFNGWFGADSCILIKSQNLGKDGNLSFSDALEMSSGLTIFTFPIDLVELQAMAEYTTAGGPKAPPAKLGGLLPSLGQSTKCCDPIAGPGATLPIGPLMLAITSRLIIDIDPANLQVIAEAPPDGCPKDVGLKKIVGIEGKASASSAAEFDAALTAFVAKAGIAGRIQFTDDVLEGSIHTEADMGGNLLRITPAMTYDMKRLDGTLSVFVEVDFFIETKRWAIELASWDGYHSNKPLGNKGAEVSACPDPKSECAPPSS